MNKLQMKAYFLMKLFVMFSIILLFSSVAVTYGISDRTEFLKTYDPEGKKDPQHYVKRYLAESKYKTWFDKNWGSKYKNIYEAVGLPEPAKSQINKITCGLGTVSKNGLCIPDENYKKQLKKQTNSQIEKIDYCSSSFIQFQCKQSYITGRTFPDIENYNLCMTNSRINCDDHGSLNPSKVQGSTKTCASIKEQLLMVKIEKKSLTPKEMASMSYKYESLMQKESELMQKLDDLSCYKN